MGPDEDDGEEFEPLPDPTLRSWRHPSELAAVAAMAARGDDRPRRPLLAPAPLALGAALGVAAALGLMAVSGALGTEPASPRVQFREAPAATSSPTSVPPASTSTTAAATAPAPATTAGTATDPTTAGAAPTVVSTPTDLLPAASVGVIPPRALIGVVTEGDDGEPACTALVVDDVIVTSASAIGSVDEVTVVIDGSRYRAQVVGRDRFTDVAVLAPPPDAPLIELPPAAGAAVDDAVTLVATDGRPEPIAVLGRVDGLGRSSSTPAGHPLIGLVTTTVRLPQPGAGALLLDTGGGVVGMVVDGPGHLAAAVPHAVIRQVVQSLVGTGHPAPVWVGVSVLDHPGGVLVATVHPDGPAERAGLRPGDVVVALAGSPVTDRGAFIAALRAHQPGDQVEVAIERRGEALSSSLAIGAPQPRQPAPSEEQAAN